MGHLSTVSRALDIKTSQVRKYIFKIQELNPRPLSGYTGGNRSVYRPRHLETKIRRQKRLRKKSDGL